MLTPRQQEILEQRDRGLTNKEIGARLGISAHTVKHHISRVLQKTGCSSCSEALFKLRVIVATAAVVNQKPGPERYHGNGSSQVVSRP